MVYRVEVYWPEYRVWVPIGPWFGQYDEACRYLATFETPDKRLIQRDRLPKDASIDAPYAGPDLSGLDLKRLEAVRYAVQRGRLGEGVALS